MHRAEHAVAVREQLTAERVGEAEEVGVRVACHGHDPFPLSVSC